MNGAEDKGVASPQSGKTLSLSVPISLADRKMGLVSSEEAMRKKISTLAATLLVDAASLIEPAIWGTADAVLPQQALYVTMLMVPTLKAIGVTEKDALGIVKGLAGRKIDDMQWFEHVDPSNDGKRFASDDVHEIFHQSAEAVVKGIYDGTYDLRSQYASAYQQFEGGLIADAQLEDKRYLDMVVFPQLAHTAFLAFQKTGDRDAIREVIDAFFFDHFPRRDQDYGEVHIARENDPLNIVSYIRWYPVSGKLSDDIIKELCSAGLDAFEPFNRKTRLPRYEKLLKASIYAHIALFLSSQDLSLPETKRRELVSNMAYYFFNPLRRKN